MQHFITKYRGFKRVWRRKRLMASTYRFAHLNSILILDIELNTSFSQTSFTPNTCGMGRSWIRSIRPQRVGSAGIHWGWQMRRGRRRTTNDASNTFSLKTTSILLIIPQTTRHKCPIHMFLTFLLLELLVQFSK